VRLGLPEEGEEDESDNEDEEGAGDRDGAARCGTTLGWALKAENAADKPGEGDAASDSIGDGEKEDGEGDDEDDDDDNNCCEEEGWEETASGRGTVETRCGTPRMIGIVPGR